MKDIRKELAEKSEYSFDDLVKIMEILRGPGGCPWDIEQDHKSIRKNFIEETYEACEAIDKEDDSLLCEELGDVILQVVFHSCIAAEREAFDIEDVLSGVCAKLVHRHPHIFGDVVASTSGQVLENWEKIKLEEKKTKDTVEDLQRVCTALPALMRAQKMIKKAKGSEYCYREVMTGAEENEEDKIAASIMDICFNAREKGIDAEEALSRYCDKYLLKVLEMKEENK